MISAFGGLDERELDARSAQGAPVDRALPTGHVYAVDGKLRRVNRGEMLVAGAGAPPSRVPSSRWSEVRQRTRRAARRAAPTNENRHARGL